MKNAWNSNNEEWKRIIIIIIIDFVLHITFLVPGEIIRNIAGAEIGATVKVVTM